MSTTLVTELSSRGVYLLDLETNERLYSITAEPEGINGRLIFQLTSIEKLSDQLREYRSKGFPPDTGEYLFTILSSHLTVEGAEFAALSHRADTMERVRRAG